MDIAIYSITQKDIVDAILKVQGRGVKVRIITDKQEAESKTQKDVIAKLKAANIPRDPFPTIPTTYIVQSKGNNDNENKVDRYINSTTIDV